MVFDQHDTDYKIMVPIVIQKKNKTMYMAWFSSDRRSALYFHSQIHETKVAKILQSLLKT